MSTPMSATQALAAANRTGYRVVQLSGWRSHNRNHKGAWGPANGVMVHHTGSDTSSPLAYVKNVLFSGYRGLPGPLCQFGIDESGAIYMVGWGRANHAGRGSAKLLWRVIRESSSLMRAEFKPRVRSVDGNPRFYGIEVMYSGGRPMTDDAYWSSVRLSAELCRTHGWGPASVISHREWSTTKWDPGHTPMVKFRRDVEAVLSGKSAAAPARDEPSVSLSTVGIDTVDHAHLRSARWHDMRATGRPLGEFSGEVLVLEKAMYRLGLLDLTYVDGHYGTQTDAAVKGYQRGLGDHVVDGWLGPQQLALLFDQADRGESTK